MLGAAGTPSATPLPVRDTKDMDWDQLPVAAQKRLLPAKALSVREISAEHSWAQSAICTNFRRSFNIANWVSGTRRGTLSPLNAEKI